MSNKCSICKEDSFLVKDQETITYNGESLTVKGLQFYECPCCKEQFVDAKLDNHNAFLIRKAKENLKGL